MRCWISALEKLQPALGWCSAFLVILKGANRIGIFLPSKHQKGSSTQEREVLPMHIVSGTLQSPVSCFLSPMAETKSAAGTQWLQKEPLLPEKGKAKKPQRKGCRLFTPSATNQHRTGVWGVNINIHLAVTASHNRHEHWLDPVLVMVLGNHPCFWLPEGSSDPLLVLSVSLFDLQMNCFW